MTGGQVSGVGSIQGLEWRALLRRGGPPDPSLRSAGHRLPLFRLRPLQ